MNRDCDRTSDARAADAGVLPGRRAGFSFVLAVGLLALCAASCHSAEAAGAVKLAKFTVLADVHFDPFFDAALVDRLAAAELREWPRVFESRPSGFSPYGTDANYRLLASVLQDARTRAPRPHFILYPGDFLAHRWRTRFDALGGDRSERAYRAFTAKVIQFLAQQFAHYFPGVPVLPTLGNEDAYCGDYAIQPEGPFLRMFAEAWRPLLGPVAAGRSDFGKVFPRGGYFSMPLPGSKAHRLVVLNTVFFSTKYENRCGNPSEDPGRQQLAWLVRTLKRAELQGERVWLLMHIPFGVDVFDTVRGEGTAPPAVFWRPEYAGPFFELLRRHGHGVQASFSGHIHMDTFRLLGDADGRTVSFNHVTPAVSPVFGNNPGYQIFSYARATGELVDYATFYLTNLIHGRARGLWRKEYAFNAAYGLSGINGRTLQQLSRQVARNAETRKKFRRYYDVSRTDKPVIAERDINAYRCALSHPTARGFTRCRREGH